MRPHESLAEEVVRGTHRWRFGPFDVDVNEHRLLKHGQVVPITHKAFALLVSWKIPPWVVVLATAFGGWAIGLLQ